LNQILFSGKYLGTDHLDSLKQEAEREMSKNAISKIKMKKSCDAGLTGASHVFAGPHTPEKQSVMKVQLSPSNPQGSKQGTHLSSLALINFPPFELTYPLLHLHVPEKGRSDSLFSSTHLPLESMKSTAAL
jgi:hypothetical protein